MNETDLMNEIRLNLSELGYKNFRINTGKVRLADGRWFTTGTPNGFSDILCVQPKTGRAMFIEVKVKPNTPTKEQLQFIKVMREQGALCVVAYSWGDVERMIKNA